MSLHFDKSTWKRVLLGDVVRNVNVSVRAPQAAGIDRVIGMEHLDPGELKIKRWGSLEDSTTFTRRVKPGQTLFGKRRSYQRKVAYADFDAICSGDILTFEPDESELLPEFLPLVVQSNEFYDHALGTSAGSLSPRTNWRDLAKFEFDLPPLDEQKHIASVFWAMERHRRALQDSAEQMAIAHAAWTAKTLGELDWSLQLSDVIDPQRPLCYGVVQPGVDVEDGIGMIRVLDLEDGAPHLSSLKRITPEIDGQYRRSRVLAGDVLLSIVGTIGRTWIVKNGFSGCNIARALARISPDKSVMRPAFLHWVLSAADVQATLLNAAFESARKTLNLSALSKVILPSLSLSEQDKLLVARTKFTRAETQLHSASISATTLRSTLLADVFGAN